MEPHVILRQVKVRQPMILRLKWKMNLTNKS